MTTFRTNTTFDIGTISAEAWDAVAGRETLQSHRWQHFRQRIQLRDWSRPWTAFVTVRRGDTLVGIATAYRYAIPYGFALRPLQSVSRVLLWPLNPINYSLPPTILAGEDRRDVYQELAQGLKALSVKTVSFGSRLTLLPADATELHDSLRENGFQLEPGVWQSELKLRYSNFEEYVRNFSEPSRRRIRYRLSLAQRSGIEMSLGIPASQTERNRCYELLANTAVGHRSRLLYGKNIFEEAETLLGADRFVFLCARLNGRIIGCLSLFCTADQGQLGSIGTDREFAGRFNTYRLLIYRAIEHGIECKHSKLVGGISNYDVKKRMGFETFQTLTAAHSFLPGLLKVYQYTPHFLQDTKVKSEPN